MSNKARWTATIIAITLAFVGIAAAFVGIFSDGFTNWDKFKPEEEQTEVTENGGMVIGGSVGSGISLKSAKIAAEDYAAYGVSPLAESAQTLTATITPSNAADKTVDWAVAWVNASSSWANGKTVTDYVTVTPTSDGALTATVECLQAFGEQIKVTVTSRQNAEATASATVDYAKRLLQVQVFDSSLRSYVFGPSTGSYEVGAGSSGYIDASDPGYKPSFLDGTIEDEFDYEITVSYSSDWCQALVDVGGFYASMIQTSYVNIPLEQLGVLHFGDLVGVDVLTTEGYNYVVEDMSTGTNGAYNAFCDALRAMDGEVIFTLNLVATGTYSTFEESIPFIVDASGFVSLVENVSLNNSSLVF